MKKLLLLVAASLLMVGCSTNTFSSSIPTSSGSEPVTSSSESESSSQSSQSSSEPVDPEPEVAVKSLAEFIAGENTKTRAYYVTAKIARFKTGDIKDEYGNMTLVDGLVSLKIYGATITASALTWNGSEYNFKNPKDFTSKTDTNALKVNDTITMKMVRCDYTEGGVTTVEGQGVITNIEPFSGDPDPVSQIKLDKSSASIRPNEVLTLVETVLPVNAISRDVTWHSENTNIAEVNENGIVIGKANGTTRIYAEPANPEYKAPGFVRDECIITVNSAISYDYNYNNYYAGLTTWSNGADLINKLHNIISYEKTSVAYDGNWTTNQGADQAQDDFEMVDLVYSQEKELKTKTNDGSTGWQREHAFCASLMTGYATGEAVGVGSGRATDFHNLFAAYGPGNGSRGNKNFGYADPFATTYQIKDDYTFDSKTFEPNDTDKGRLTRSIFYMAVMYNEIEENIDVATKLNYDSKDRETYDQQSVTVHVNATYKPLTIVEEDVPYKKYSYTQWHYNDDETSDKYPNDDILKALVLEYGNSPEGYAAYSRDNCQFAIGNRSTLLKWAGLDVDLAEMQHNNYVYANAQNNRNPFVDYPELINYAFGDYADQPGSLENVRPAYMSLKMDKEEIHHYAIQTAKREYDVGQTFVSSDYTIVGVRNDLSTVAATYEDQTAPYTFKESDAGNMKMTILTPINTIKLPVKVNTGSLSSCSYIGLLKPLGKGAFTNGGTTNIKYSTDPNNGIDWKFSWTNENATTIAATEKNGIQFGKAGEAVGELTAETVNEFTVNMAYIKINCASGKTINYAIYVGATKVSEGSVAYNSEGAVTKGANFASTSGKVKVVINGSGASSAAVYLHTLAFNEITA